MSTDELQIHRVADTVPHSADYMVTVNGSPVHVHDCEVAAYALWSFSGSVEVRVAVRENHRDIVVRPWSLGTGVRWEGSVATFTLEQPTNLCFDPPWQRRKPLFLFASAIDRSPPSRDDPAIRYFEGGTIHDAGVIVLESGQTLYIEAGAVVRGAVEVVGAERVRIAGRGILDGSCFRPHERRLIYFGKCSDVAIEGITTVQTPSWTIMLHRCKNAAVREVNEIGWVVGSDGVDIVASHNVSVERCFLRNNDDCIAVKAFRGYRQVVREDEEAPVPMTVEHVRVRDCTFFNAHAGNVMEIGFELRSELVRDVVFSNCDVIAAHGEGGVFTIHNGDHALVENVRYEDIRVEHYYDRFVDFRVLRSRYSRDEERGRIRNVTVRNVCAVQNTHNSLSLLGGYDRDHLVENISFEHVCLGQQPVRCADDLHLFANEHVRNVTFR